MREEKTKCRQDERISRDRANHCAENTSLPVVFSKTNGTRPTLNLPG
jgi:hypothetical protein